MNSGRELCIYIDKIPIINLTHRELGDRERDRERKWEDQLAAQKWD